MYNHFTIDFDTVDFEWDDEKDNYNFATHGIRFKTAAKVFLDPDALIRDDDEHLGEERYDVIGSIGKIIFVVITIRKGNTIRIISARCATKPEKERYLYGKNEY
ncbi:BrnT family toxin [Butyrivibrio sp. XPD2006]|uniref:BrnT family toxin n=1 Tax=Butyrivibrio sp. XPD2006 TaxID=1280668 RepID=UPI0003B33F4C|nr:BrnT family toxin [Butyrivibrio sp. XPD2006]